jgi:hypothetical protein
MLLAAQFLPPSVHKLNASLINLSKNAEIQLLKREVNRFGAEF